MNAQPVTILDGDLAYRGAERRWNLRAGYERDLLERAAGAHAIRRRHRAALAIHDEINPRLFERASEREMAWALEEQAMRRPPGPLWHSTPVRARCSMSADDEQADEPETSPELQPLAELTVRRFEHGGVVWADDTDAADPPHDSPAA